MAYTDNNTPVIEQITLPSGNSYYIADREIRDVVDALSQTVAGGVSYVVAWDGTSAPVVGNIPAGVTVTYSGTSYTGTLDANNATPGAFYLVKSTTQVDGKDVYDEYVPVGSEGNKSWEKIGDTQIALADVVTGVSLSKQTDTVIGTDATFTITQPTVALSTGANAGAGVVSVATGISSVTQPTVSLSEESSTATGRVAYTKSVSTTKLSAAASGGDADWGSKDTKTVLTGVQVTAQPTVSLTANESTGTGRITYLESQGSATTTKLSASTSGGGVAWDSKDAKTALTGVKVTAQPTVTLTANAAADTGRITYLEGASASNTNVKATASGANTAWNSKDQKTVVTSYPGVTGSAASSVTPTTKKLATTTVTGVSGSTNITPVESRSSQTTATGGWTALTPGSTDANSNGNPDVNENLLANISVTNGVLSIGAASLNTQTTYSAGAPRASLAVPTAASATRVATGSVNTTDTNGASIVTDVAVGDTVTVLTGLGTPTTANVIGSSSTFTVTQPTVALATNATAGTGVVSLTNDITPTTKYMSASASGTAVGANGTASVIGASSTFTHTNPTVTLATGSTGDVTVATGVNAGTTKYLSASASGTTVGANGTASVIGSSATISHTNPTVTLSTGSTGDVTVATGGTTKYMAAAASGTAVTPTTTNLKATASGANTAWNSKDSVTVLKSTTDVSVTKGNA